MIHQGAVTLNRANGFMTNPILSMILTALILVLQSLVKKMEGLIQTMRSGDGNLMVAQFQGTYLHLKLYDTPFYLFVLWICIKTLE